MIVLLKERQRNGSISLGVKRNVPCFVRHCLVRSQYGVNGKAVEDGKRTCVYCHWLVTNEVLHRPVNFGSANEFQEFRSVR